MLVNSGEWSGKTTEDARRRWRITHSTRLWRSGDDIPTARLGHFPPAILGFADTDQFIAKSAERCRRNTRICRSGCRRLLRSPVPANRRWPRCRSLRNDLSELRRPGSPRDGHDGHVRRFVVVLLSIHGPEERDLAVRSRDRSVLDAGRSVHRRRRSRRDAPDLRAILDKGDAGSGVGEV